LRFQPVGQANAPVPAAVSTRAIVAGALVAGGGGAAGIPAHSVSLLLYRDLLTCMSSTAGGISSACTASSTDLPQIIAAMKEEIARALSGKRFALVIDGGSSKLCDGVKVLAVCAVSPELDHDMVIGLFVLRRHENGELQAKILHELMAEYSIPVTNVAYLSAGGASVNKTTVDILNAEYGWRVKYARCLAHAINRLIVPFCDQIDEAFSLSGFLQSLRGFVKAGGGPERRRAMAEWGLTLFGLDFVCTRWTSFIKAVMYLVSLQTERELKAANEMLKEAADDGDKDAAAALAAEAQSPAQPQLH